MQAIADRERVTQRRIAHLVDLAFLAPGIVRSIVEGRQPSNADRRPPDQVAASDALV
jgi:hypothetical protein